MTIDDTNPAERRAVLLQKGFEIRDWKYHAVQFERLELQESLRRKPGLENQGSDGSLGQLWRLFFFRLLGKSRRESEMLINI